MNTQVCEGCAATERGKRQPDGWCGYGMSARKDHTVAVWCAECVANGIMERFSATTYRRAVAVAKSRGLLAQIIGAP